MNPTQLSIWQRTLLLAAALGALWAATPAPAMEHDEPPSTEQLPPGAKVLKLEALPTALDLSNQYAYGQLVVLAQLASGDKVDVTRMARVSLTQPVVKVSRHGQVRPVENGSAEVKCSLAGHSVSVPVKVSSQKEHYKVSFVRDVMPTISRMGCNAGTCHGSAQGKNGFQLSLRGYDPLFDHRALTDDIQGRRFNRAAPEQSLMLLKMSGEVPHVGGVLTKPGESYYELLRAWIGDGVKLDLGAPRVKSIEIYPKSPSLPLPGMKQQMGVLATYTDGSMRNVSAEAFVESSNTEVATVDKQGLVTAVRRGETAILARYEGSYAATTLIVMGDRGGYAWKPVPEYNFIDTLVYDKLKQMRILPSDVCADSDFIRRVYLDLTGLPPQPQDVRAFLADSRPEREKRDDLVDRLVGSADFVEHWTNKWADLLQVNSKFLGEIGAKKFRAWIREAVSDNVPYDRLCHILLTASGSNVQNPPASYFKILRDPDAAMENTTHLFLAVRFNCNKCHDHPFERWTQNQYYNMAAFFAQVARAPDPQYKGKKIPGTDVNGPKDLVEIISDSKTGDVKNLRTGAVAAPTFPFTHAEMPPANLPRREQLARWITSKDNPYFAKSYVNRVWSYLLGVGIIEPVDDIRAGNPPSNPKLLDRLTEDFVHSGFNVRHLIRTICQSRTYQHAIEANKWNADDNVNYSHAVARRLSAEVLYDAIHRASGSVTHLPGLPAGARAAQLLDANVKVPGGFLEQLGRPPRESACECERTSSMQLGPVLSLVTGPVINDALRDPANRLAKIVAGENDDAKVIEEVFLSILSRRPSPKELSVALKEFQGNAGEFAELRADHKRRKDALAVYEKQLPTKQLVWEKSMAKLPHWTMLRPDSMKSAEGATLTLQPDNSVLASGKNPDKDTYTISVTTEMTGITALRLEVMTDKKLPARGPGRAPNGNFVLQDFKVTTEPAENEGEEVKPQKVAFGRSVADFSQDGFNVAGAVDDNPTSGWAVAPVLGRSHVAVFESKSPVGFLEGTKLTFTLKQDYGGKHVIGRLRLSATTLKPPVPLQILPEEIAGAIKVAAKDRTAAQKATLTNYFRSRDAELARLQREYNELVIPADARTMAAQDLAWALMNSPAFLFNH
jgi:hypothetical protein